MSPIPRTPARSASPDRRRAVVLGGVQPRRAHAGQRRRDGTIRLWDVADPAHPRPLGQPLTGGTAPSYSVAFSPGGRTLATGGDDGAVRLWDVADPAHPRPLGQPLTGGTGAVTRWRSAPAGARWPAAATTARSGCGTSPIPRTPARSASP